MAYNFPGIPSAAIPPMGELPVTGIWPPKSIYILFRDTMIQ